jgi:hypothetical protein
MSQGAGCGGTAPAPGAGGRVRWLDGMLASPRQGRPAGAVVEPVKLRASQPVTVDGPAAAGCQSAAGPRPEPAACRCAATDACPPSVRAQPLVCSRRLGPERVGGRRELSGTSPMASALTFAPATRVVRVWCWPGLGQAQLQPGPRVGAGYSVPHATCAYSWISPPSRSCRTTPPASRMTGSSAGPSGGACPKARFGRWLL